MYMLMKKPMNQVSTKSKETIPLKWLHCPGSSNVREQLASWKAKMAWPQWNLGINKCVYKISQLKRKHQIKAHTRHINKVWWAQWPFKALVKRKQILLSYKYRISKALDQDSFQLQMIQATLSKHQKTSTSWSLLLLLWIKH